MDHARGLEDFVLKTQKKKRQRKKQRERERERERENDKRKKENELISALKALIIVKCQENFSLAEMQFSFLKLTSLLWLGYFLLKEIVMN